MSYKKVIISFIKYTNEEIFSLKEHFYFFQWTNERFSIPLKEDIADPPISALLSLRFYSFQEDKIYEDKSNPRRPRFFAMPNRWCFQVDKYKVIMWETLVAISIHEKEFITCESAERIN